MARSTCWNQGCRGGLDRPAGMTFGLDGALYVSDTSRHLNNGVTFFDVLRYDGKTGDFIDVFAEVPDNRAYGLEFGPDGLYIGHWDFGDGVLQFDGQSGELIDIVVPRGLGGVASVSFVHFGPDGMLYVSPRSTGLHRFELIKNGRDVLLGDQQTHGGIDFGSQQTGTDLAEDLTGNGFVDFEDLTVLLAAWNQNVDAAQGNLVNPSGTPVNFEDLTVLLAAWTGPGGAAAPPAEQAVRSDRIHAVDQDPMNRGLQQDPMNRVTTSAGVETSSVVENHQRRGKPAAYQRRNPLRRLQAAAVDRALVEDFAHEREIIARRRTPIAPSADA